MSNKIRPPLRLIVNRMLPRSISGILFNEKENRIIASFRLQAKENSLILKIVYRNTGKIILAVFDEILSEHGLKELEFEETPGHIISIWKINYDLNTIFDRIQNLAKHVNSR